jgi:hypothetical protein
MHSETYRSLGEPRSLFHHSVILLQCPDPTTYLNR